MKTIFEIPGINYAGHVLARLLLHVFVWKVEKNRLPKSITKSVVIAAPHTSNWDVIIMLLTGLYLRLPMYWMGKAELFRFPFKPLMMFLGGIPVNRGTKEDMVKQVATFILRHNGSIMLFVAPEGTRKRVDEWKSGFYHIAKESQVPIVLGYINYGNQMAGLAEYFYPSSDVPLDMEIVRGFYRYIRPKNEGMFESNWRLKITNTTNH